ncbi:MAG: hypothetical protein DI549_01680 [Ancylobacter novellus]|uniref:Uncharacterized protein n=1 Tax=Ancylobacter novellus TaxID=921 RepID=A0A2W5R6U2_ANCNO|nr:MAG: hypothetical protein DI549_01680 [Ancylobacter novellus]
MSIADSIGAATVLAVGLAATGPAAERQADMAETCPASYEPFGTLCLNPRSGDIVNILPLGAAAAACADGYEPLGEACFDPLSGDIENPRRREASQ